MAKSLLKANTLKRLISDIKSTQNVSAETLSRIVADCEASKPLATASIQDIADHLSDFMGNDWVLLYLDPSDRAESKSHRKSALKRYTNNAFAAVAMCGVAAAVFDDELTFTASREVEGEYLDDEEDSEDLGL